MQYKKGDRVRHPKKPDWGIGQVLADSTGGTVQIFFTHAGEKTGIRIKRWTEWDDSDRFEPVDSGLLGGHRVLLKVFVFHD